MEEESINSKKKKKYRLKRNGWNCSKNLSPFRIKVECREKSRFYTNCTVFKMAQPPCKIILNDPLVPCNFTDLTRTPHSAAIFISTIHSAANWNKKMALTIWSNLTERQRAMAIPFQLVSQIFMEFPVHIRIYVIIRGKESETKNSLLGNNYRICDNLIFNDTLEEFNVFSLAQVKLRVDCIKLKLILQWYGVLHYAVIHSRQWKCIAKSASHNA